MWVHPEKKICFLANPKTASTAIYRALETLGFESHGNQHCTPDNSGWGYWYKINDTWITFCTVRNHFDVMVSWYYHCTRKPGLQFSGWQFDSFIREWIKWRNWFRDGKMYWERNPWCNKILRYETLQKDFNRLLVVHGFPEIKLELHNVSEKRKGKSYQEHYTNESRQFVKDFFGGEMKELKYSF